MRLFSFDITKRNTFLMTDGSLQDHLQMLNFIFNKLINDL